MQHVDNLILGAGISGLAAGQRLKELNKNYKILEKNNSYGGLCDNFEIDGFRFDRFVHLSFAKDEKVRHFFDQVDYYTHIPNPSNYYHGTWLKHPAQNNLYPLSEKEKELILQDMKKRDKYRKNHTENYENWLRYQFGDYFAEHFPMEYTKKYWGVTAEQLETKWIGNRIYQPTMDEILEGMKTSDTPVTYYAKEMRYPKKGGYKAFLSSFSNVENIIFNEEVLKIDLQNKKVITSKNEHNYGNLYSSLPLPEYLNLLDITDQKVIEAVQGLHWTSGYIVSLGFKGELLREDIWDYIYDSEILPARIYSPSKKAVANCPDGCSSIQAEIYFKDDNLPTISQETLLEDVITQLNKAQIIESEKLIVKDIRFEKYANVIFDQMIYKNRKIVHDYLKEHKIIPIGRFGEWDYLWSDQSFLSGYNI